MSPVAPSWQEHRLRAVELGEELSPVALCAHDKRCPFQLLQRRIAYRNLSQADAMLSGGVFQLRQTKLHLDHSRAKCLAKLAGSGVKTPTAVNSTPAAATSSYIASNQSEATCPAPAPMSARMIGAPPSILSTNTSSPAGV